MMMGTIIPHTGMSLMKIKAATNAGTINTLMRERVFGTFNDLDIGNIFLSCIYKDLAKNAHIVCDVR